MAGNPITGDGLSATSLAGMSKNQLYDIMSQMKTLIEQNQQQAREILIQNPLLTRALFQAQIMLGMMQPPPVIPNIQPAVSQHAQQPVQPAHQPSIQAAPSMPNQVGSQEQTSASRTQIPGRKQPQEQPTMPPITSASVPTVNLQSQPIPSHPPQTIQQPKGHPNVQFTPLSLPQTSQLSNVPPLPIHSASQTSSLVPPQIPIASGQMQPPLPTTGIPHMHPQPPLPPQPRPHSMPNFHHQPSSQMGPNVGFQHSGAPQHSGGPQLHHPQTMYHPGSKHPANIGPSFPQGQPPLPNQPPPQSHYQVGGGSHMGAEFGNHGVGNSHSMQGGSSSWMPENTMSNQGPAPPPPPQLLSSAQLNQPLPPRPPPLSSEMEKQLLHQVMSLTPEQINLLPPEQRHQVLQLQQILRQ